MELVTGFEGFEDDPEAPYYRSQKWPLNPAQTWAAIHDRLVALLLRIGSDAAHMPIRIDLDRILAWHRALFDRDFWMAGTLRSVDTQFTYVDPKRGRVSRAGSEPGRVRIDLRGVLEDHAQRIAAARATGTVAVGEACETAARLYAGLLAVHPFDDGNGRVSYVALQAALRSQGVPWINFAGVRGEHDACLGAGLVVTGEPDYAPLTDLLVRIVAAGDLDTIRS